MPSLVFINQMYILMALFFASLFCIIFMIGRKLSVLRREQINGEMLREEVMLEFPYIGRVRHLTVQNIKKFEHATLVIFLRFYVRSSNSIKNKYGEIKSKIKNRGGKGANGESAEKEANKFLKMMSDYKHKIRKIKQKIHEEEKNS